MSTALQPLWQIEAELVALLDTIDGCPDELLPEIQERINGYLCMERRKVDSISAVLAMCEQVAQAASDEMDRLAARKKAAEKSQESLEAYVVRVMQGRGVRKLEGATGALSLRKSERVVVTNEDAVPEWFKHQRTETKVSAGAIKAALKAGEDVPGAVLEQRDNLQRS